MKKDNKDTYLKLFRDGYFVDIDKKCFYSKNIKSFKAPKGMEEWKVEEFDEKRYYNDRVLKELGITENDNEVLLYENANKKGRLNKNKIFTTNKFGDIEITLFSLDRIPFTFHKAIASHTNIVEKEDVITRFTPWRAQLEGRKYHISGQTGTHPFIHPKIIKAYEKEEEIKTLVITEGAFKAFKATQEGVYTIGLSSITHYRDSENGELHADIIQIINKCKVTNVVILWDGDCLDISSKALSLEEDLMIRPLGFYASAKKIRDSLKQFVSKKTNIFFAHVNSKTLSNGHPKGIDDLFVNYMDSKESILEDFINIGSVPGRFIKWIDITLTSKMKYFYNYFKLNNVEQFYSRHSKLITDKEFILNGTTYRYDYVKSQVEVLVPKSAKDYIRVGTDFYHTAMIPNKSGQLSEELIKWNKATIFMDHGKEFIEHIPKYKKFVNVPSHENYQKVVSGCYNRYFDIEHKTCIGSWEHIKQFLKHVFEEHYEYGLDYIQLLYTNPQQPLPILCLASKENETGKSTFINLLKWIFQSNMAIIGNSELESEFNSGWVSKLIIASEETFLDKKATMEKIKSLSTAESVSMNQKGLDLVEIDFFGKFIFATNNEESFIKISNEDKRYWIRKVKSIPVDKKDEEIKAKMKAEIPAFIHYLLNRELFVKESKGRMWFDTDELRTEAFYNVTKHSVPAVEKEIREQIKEMFYEFNKDIIELSIKDIQELFSLKRFEKSYIKLVLVNHLKVELIKNSLGVSLVKRYEIPRWSLDSESIEYDKKVGRPYVFYREDFIDKEVGNDLVDAIKSKEELQKLEPDSKEKDLPF